MCSLQGTSPCVLILSHLERPGRGGHGSWTCSSRPSIDIDIGELGSHPEEGGLWDNCLKACFRASLRQSPQRARKPRGGTVGPQKGLSCPLSLVHVSPHPTPYAPPSFCHSFLPFSPQMPFLPSWPPAGSLRRGSGQDGSLPCVSLEVASSQAGQISRKSTGCPGWAGGPSLGCQGRS